MNGLGRPASPNTALAVAASALAAALLCASPCAGSDDPMRGPWGEPSASADGATNDDGFRFPGGVLDWALAGYQAAASPVSAGRCPMTPSCSTYAREAIARYGALQGAMMTVDRLLHEQGLVGEVPVIEMPDGSLRWLDPPEENLLGAGR